MIFYITLIKNIFVEFKPCSSVKVRRILVLFCLNFFKVGYDNLTDLQECIVYMKKGCFE